jgi:hypothetical protein
VAREPLLVLGVGKPFTLRGRGVYQREYIRLALRELMHVHVIGSSGYGKSYWLAALYLILLSCGLTVTVLDPAGDLAKLVLKLLLATQFFTTYPDALSRFVYLNISAGADRGLYVPYNPLNIGEPPDVAAALVVEAFKRASSTLASGSAPNIETLIRNGAHALAENKLPLLPYLHYLYTDQTFRERVLANVSDPIVKQTFVQFGFTRGGKPSSTLIPAINRINKLASSRLLRYTLGQYENVLDFKRIIADGNRSLAINLNTADPEDMQFLGCLLTVYAELGAKRRGQVDKNDRKTKHMLIIDEFQNFVSRSARALIAMFEQTRKYGLFLTLSHQYWGQIPEEMRGAVNQCEINVVFRVKGEDAAKSHEYLGFEHEPFLPKPVGYINPLSTRAFTPQYYSEAEQRSQRIALMAKLPKKTALIQRPNHPLYLMQAPEVDDRSVSADAVAELEEQYFKRYFRSEADIKADIARRLAEYGVDINTTSDNTTDTSDFDAEAGEERKDDFDNF